MQCIFTLQAATTHANKTNQNMTQQTNDWLYNHYLTTTSLIVDGDCCRFPIDGIGTRACVRACVPTARIHIINTQPTTPFQLLVIGWRCSRLMVIGWWCLRNKVDNLHFWEGFDPLESSSTFSSSSFSCCSAAAAAAALWLFEGRLMFFIMMRDT